MSDLPDGWEMVELQDLAAPEPRSITDGPFGSNLKTAHYTDAGPRVLRLQNIGFGEFMDEYAHISEEHFESLRNHEVRAGDLVIASLGENLPRCCVISPSVGPAIVKADCIRVRLHADIDARYVNYALQRPELKAAVADQIHGVGRPRLGMEGIRILSVPLAPKGEQARIVAAIEERLSGLAVSIDTLSKIVSRVVLLRERAVGALFDPTWPRVDLIDALQVFSDCPHRTPQYEAGGEYPALRPRDVVNGVLRVEGAARVGRAEYEIQVARDAPRAGDVVYSRELSYGWAAVVPADEQVCLSQGMVLMRSSTLLPEFLATFLNSDEARRQAHVAATGSAHPHLNLRDIKRYQVPLVPRENQVALLERSAVIESACDRLIAVIGGALIRARQLRRAVLTAAFSGVLVQPDSADEPASVLLGRVAADRTNAARSNRKRRVKAS